MTTINDLRDVITIQVQGTAQDDVGEPVKTWADVATVWAYIRDVTGRRSPGGELIEATALQSQVASKITIRFRRDVLSEMRVVCGDTVYRVQDVLDPTGRRTWLDLMCARGFPE